MKKLTLLLLMCFMLLGNTKPILASDSAVASGIGYTLKGSIYDSYISASATGEKSSNVNVALTDAYYLNDDELEVKAANRSSMTYISYYGSSVGSTFWKWQRVKVIGTLLSSGKETKLRTLYN